jgi:small-conductance mechanosensitive channel
LFLGFGDSALLFELRSWTGQDKFLRVRSDVTVAVEQALRKAGITIPFPQRDLHVKSMSSDAQDALLPSKAPRERPADNDPPPSPDEA